MLVEQRVGLRVGRPAHERPFRVLRARFADDPPLAAPRIPDIDHDLALRTGQRVADRPVERSGELRRARVCGDRSAERRSEVELQAARVVTVNSARREVRRNVANQDLRGSAGLWMVWLRSQTYRELGRG